MDRTGLFAFLRKMGLSNFSQSSILPSVSSSPMGDPAISPSSVIRRLELPGLDARMSRRSLMKLLLTSAAVATTVDIEQLLWVPKPIIVVPSLGANPNMGQIVAEAWEKHVESFCLDGQFSRLWLLEHLDDGKGNMIINHGTLGGPLYGRNDD